MGHSYFIWNDMDCRSMGVRLLGPVPIVRPEERVRHVQIPGLAGDLTQLEGNSIFNSYIQTASIHVHGWSNVRDVFNWLKGEGYVTFSGEPDRRQKARIIGAVTLNKHSKNMDVWSGEVQFYCQPFKQKLKEESVVLTSSGKLIVNTGDVDEKPLIHITANATSAMIDVGGRTLNLTTLVNTYSYWIDCETMEIRDNAMNNNMLKYASGDFPILPPGTSKIIMSGISWMEILRRERFL